MRPWRARAVLGLSGSSLVVFCAGFERQESRCSAPIRYRHVDRDVRGAKTTAQLGDLLRSWYDQKHNWYRRVQGAPEEVEDAAEVSGPPDDAVADGPDAVAGPDDAAAVDAAVAGPDAAVTGSDDAVAAKVMYRLAV